MSPPLRSINMFLSLSIVQRGTLISIDKLGNCQKCGMSCTCCLKHDARLSFSATYCKYWSLSLLPRREGRIDKRATPRPRGTARSARLGAPAGGVRPPPSTRSPSRGAAGGRATPPARGRRRTGSRSARSGRRVPSVLLGGRQPNGQQGSDLIEKK